MCGLFWGAHKSLAPRARTLLGGLGQATLSFFAVATPLFVFFGECPKFCDLAKQRREIVGGVSEVGKDDFSLYFFWRCVISVVFHFSSAANRLCCAHWVRTILVPCTVLYRVQVQCTTCSAQYLCSIEQTNKKKKKNTSDQKYQFFTTPPHVIQHEIFNSSRLLHMSSSIKY